MIKTNKKKLVMQSVVGQISSPTFSKTPYVISADVDALEFSLPI
ncbi:MAG: hypothetical protein ACUZ8O_00680 [Candidatus Anammoxibacter sp.]